MSGVGIFPICAEHWQKNYQSVSRRGPPTPLEPCALCKSRTKRRAKLSVDYVRTLLGVTKL